MECHKALILSLVRSHLEPQALEDVIFRIDIVNHPERHSYHPFVVFFLSLCPYSRSAWLHRRLNLLQV